MVNPGIKHRKSPTHKEMGNGFYDASESGNIQNQKSSLISRIFCNFFMWKKSQICYPLIEERDLQGLPEALKDALLTYFKNPFELEKKHRDNIYHNLYKKNATVFEKIAQKYRNKAMLVRYFQNSNLFTIKKKKLEKIKKKKIRKEHKI